MEALLAFPSIATHADPSSWLTACWAEPWPQLGSTQELCTSDGDPLTEAGSANSLLGDLLAAAGTTQADFKKQLLLDKRRTCCHSVLPASWPQHPCQTSASDKKTRGWSQSLWPPSTCFNLPRQTGGLVHCPLRQVIVADPSKT